MPWQRFWFESRQPLDEVASDVRYARRSIVPRLAAGDGTQVLGSTLIEKWNGTKWSLVRTPNPPGLGVLGGVVCPSPTHCTAVGYENPSSTLVLHT